MFKFFISIVMAIQSFLGGASDKLASAVTVTPTPAVEVSPIASAADEQPGTLTPDQVHAILQSDRLRLQRKSVTPTLPAQPMVAKTPQQLCLEQGMAMLSEALKERQKK